MQLKRKELVVVMELDSNEVVSILDFFDDLEDPRSSINRKHRLVDIMVICVAAVVAGCDGPRSIGIWAQSKKAWCEKYLELPNGLPSHYTIGRVLAIVSPSGPASPGSNSGFGIQSKQN